jgi:2-dehydro-3-deoxyphosphogluconate aldolase/(4S)-4-hydroxy-2-oxoglutarate aldolase
MSAATVSDALSAHRILPVAVVADPRTAPALAGAVAAGGVRIVEVTLRTAAALDAIRAMANDPGILIGAGTVTTAAQVGQAVHAGARFIVSPGFGARVVRECERIGVPVFPGVATATEIQIALDAGLETVKFFPAEQLGGAAIIRALAPAYPSVRFIPTGGVNAGNLADYLTVPAVAAVGGSWMVAPELLAAGRFDEITLRTAAAVAAAHR